jgi:hypothetical protein
LKNSYDTQYFDKFEEKEPWFIPEEKKPYKQRKDPVFVGYTFKRENNKTSHLL